MHRDDKIRTPTARVPLYDLKSSHASRLEKKTVKKKSRCSELAQSKHRRAAVYIWIEAAYVNQDSRLHILARSVVNKVYVRYNFRTLLILAELLYPILLVQDVEL